MNKIINIIEIVIDILEIKSNMHSISKIIKSNNSFIPKYSKELPEVLKPHSLDELIEEIVSECNV